MATSRPASRVLSRGDSAGFVLFVVAGAAIAVWAVIRSTANIVAALPNRDVVVPTSFLGTVAQASAAGVVTLERDTEGLVR